MCASCIPLLLILLVPCSMRMEAEGLPTFRRERGAHQDIIAGADFLSVLMDSAAVRQAYRELSTTAAVTTTTFRTTLQIPSNSLSEYLESNTPVVREQRSSRSTTAVEPHSFTQLPNDFGANNNTFLNTSDKTILNKVNFTKHSSDNIKSNGSLIISVLVSSSEGDSHINKIPYDPKTGTDQHRTVVETTSELTTPGDQTVISSEDHPSIVAESSKSEFSVDEREPITSNRNTFDDYTQEYPANVQPLPSPQVPSSPSKETLQHHSVIYHDNPNEPIRGRSVSYSAVIQTLPKQPIVRTWTNENQEHKERQERHYELGDRANDNQFSKDEEKQRNENAKENSSSSAAETSNYYVTSKYETSSNYHGVTPSEQKETSWEKPEEAYVSSESSLRKHAEPTEKDWEAPEKNHGQQEKPYPPTIRTEKHRIPVVYGKPEQNYEVDEAVSVMTNGRAHGVQSLDKQQISTPTVEIRTGQANDSQKVGYVVEGRNYRKYRVEERTSDGFIVGEYGVVSHDNGALRGVRYTADGTVNPRLIYDALMKFLSL